MTVAKGTSGWVVSPARFACLVLTLLATSGLSCGLDTRLEDEVAREGTTDAGARRDGPAAARFAALLDPPAGSEEIPRNLAQVTVAFAQGLQDPAAVALLLVVSGRPRPLGPLHEVLCEAPGGCYAADVAVDAEPALPPLARIEVRQVSVAWLADGDPAAPGTIGHFVTAANTDEIPPRTGPARVEPATDCLRLRVRSDEPTRLELRTEGRAPPLLLTALGTMHDWAFRVPAGGSRLTLGAWDRAGNPASPVFIVAPDASLVRRVVITEVHANPLGAEGVQEYVELTNAEAEPVSLIGYRIEDAAGSDELASGALVPGGRLLVVPRDFDPAAFPDLRPGTSLIRVDARLGKDGLSGRERVTLRSPDGAPVSSYGGWLDMASARWSGASTHRRGVDACDHPTAWSNQPQPPTPGY